MESKNKHFFKTFLYPYRFAITGALILGAIYGMINTLSYWMMASIFNILFKTSNVSLNGAPERISYGS